jgi:hypothetical protein
LGVGPFPGEVAAAIGQTNKANNRNPIAAFMYALECEDLYMLQPPWKKMPLLYSAISWMKSALIKRRKS